MLVDEIRRCNDTHLCWLALHALTQYEPAQFSKDTCAILRSIYHGQAGRPKTNLQIRQLCGQLLLRTDLSIGDLVNLIVRRLNPCLRSRSIVLFLPALGSRSNEPSVGRVHVALDFQHGGE